MIQGRRLIRLAAAMLGCAVLAACATTQRIEAAGDVHALLIAIRDDNHAAFDAHVDRGALERELRGRIVAATDRAGQSDAAQGLGALLAGPLARLAGETLLRPKVFLAVAEYYGYSPDTPIPSQLVIAAALRALPDGRVCAARKHDGPCILTFADEAGVWRLVSFDGDLNLLAAK
jgi:hypothetical protein